MVIFTLSRLAGPDLIQEQKSGISSKKTSFDNFDQFAYIPMGVIEFKMQTQEKMLVPDCLS